MASAETMPKPSSLLTAEGWKSNWFAGDVLHQLRAWQALARTAARKTPLLHSALGVSWKRTLQPCSPCPYTV